jgi:hypothetical protein
MTIRELAFEVHYGGRINRGLTCTYVGGDVDVHAETYDDDKLSFFEIEGIVKNYGYKSEDLVYYLVPGCQLAMMNMKMMMRIMMVKTVGLIGMILIRKRFLNRICLMKITTPLGHPW